MIQEEEQRLSAFDKIIIRTWKGEKEGGGTQCYGQGRHSFFSIVRPIRHSHFFNKRPECSSLFLHWSKEEVGIEQKIESGARPNRRKSRKTTKKKK